MKYRLKIAENGTVDFKKVKEEGFYGVIFSEKNANKKGIISARKKKLKVFLHFGTFERISCSYLKEEGLKDGVIYAVTKENVKSAFLKMTEISDLIDGIIIPIPQVKGLLWRDNFPKLYENFSKRDITEDLALIFDDFCESADIRMWYYYNAVNTVFYDYVMPICEFVHDMGKKACFDFGSIKTGLELIKKQTNPLLFEGQKIPVIYENDGKIVFHGGKSEQKDGLLVIPMRSVMRGYAWDMKRTRLETPLNIALSQEEYYTERLKAKNLSYRIISEFEFSKMKTAGLKKYDNIIIPDSCTFLKKDKIRIETLKNEGYRINDKEILKMLDKES